MRCLFVMKEDNNRLLKLGGPTIVGKYVLCDYHHSSSQLIYQASMIIDISTDPPNWVKSTQKPLPNFDETMMITLTYWLLAAEEYQR